MILHARHPPGRHPGIGAHDIRDDGREDQMMGLKQIASGLLCENITPLVIASVTLCWGPVGLLTTVTVFSRNLARR